MIGQSEKSSDIIAADLREKIVQGTIAPNTRLTHRDIADQYGVSSFPARDALKCLINEGLILQPSPKTTIVTPITSGDFIDIMEMRSLLEPRAIELSGPRLTQKRFEEIRTFFPKEKDDHSPTEIAEFHWLFHKALYRHAGRPRLLETIYKLNIHLNRYLVPNWVALGVMNDWVEHHKELLVLVENSHFTQAADLLREDIDHTTLLVLKNLII